MSQQGLINMSPREAAMLTWMNEFAPYGVITTDLSLRVQSWNRWMQTKSNIAADSVIGRELLELYPDLKTRKLTGILQRALRGEISVLSTALHKYLLPLPSSIREPGFIFMQQTARIGPLLLEKEIQGVIIVIEDVTQREFQAAILREKHHRDALMAWALAHLLKSQEPKIIVRELFNKAAEYLDFDTYLLYLMDPEGGKLRLHAAGGVSPEMESSLASLSCDEAKWLGNLHSPKPLVLENVQNSTDFRCNGSRRLELTATASFPLLSGQNSLGTLFFGTRSRNTIPETEVQLLSVIAQYLAVALNREFMNAELLETQKKLSHYAQDLENKVAERTAKLKETITELETFSYTLAHDLKAPVRALAGYCDVLQEEFNDRLSPDAGFIIGRLSRASHQLETLTGDLLEFSRISRQEIQLAVLDPHEIILDVISLIFPGHQEFVQVQKTLHRVVGHRALLLQCVSNLIDNGLKFVTPGIKPSVWVWTELVEHSTPSTRKQPLLFSAIEPDQESKKAQEIPGTPIPPSSVPSRQRVRLWVVDQGIGISGEAHQKVFGIFERGSNSGDYQGTGIGLAIVARAVQRMGGTCGVESAVGAGSRFWLELQAPD